MGSSPTVLIMSTTAEAKSAIRMRFFEMLFGTAKGYVCFATTDPRAPKTTFLQKFFEWPKDSLKAENWIIKVEQNHNVYFCINMLDKQERKKDNCLPGNLLWADLDTVNPDTLIIPAPIIIRSSAGRWQAIWRMTSQVPATQQQDYSHRIAYRMGADKSGWDLTQLLRVPLTTNFKYQVPVLIELEKCLELTAAPHLFESLPFDYTKNGEPLDDPPQLDEKLNADGVVKKWLNALGPGFWGDYTFEPDENDDWSVILWRLMHRCYETGMSQEEVFIVAQSAKCNKYARDGRPVQHLWRDVLKASEVHQFADHSRELLTMPELVEHKESDTFLDKYREWATEITDAVPEFHDLCMIVVLSAIVASSVRIDCDVGDIVPNVWGLILGDSTTTRKTTAMGHAMRLLLELDPDLVVATDATAEGLIQAISKRPNKSSMFHRDEVAGLFESMARKDYMSGFQEVLTQLYDVPTVFKRQLRKEEIIIDSPAFIMLCGGVKNRIHSTTNESFVLSGFLPRFLVVSGEPRDARPLGPSKKANDTKRAKILEGLADIYENYATPVQQKIGGVVTLEPPKYMARLTDEAWDTWNSMDRLLTKTAQDSLIPDLALPTFSRLSKSILKMSAVLAATRQRPGEFASTSPSIVVGAEDVKNAAWYVQEWGKHSIDLVINAGKSPNEYQLEKILNFIKERPGVLKSDLFRRFHLDAKYGDYHMETLEKRGLIRKESRGKATLYWSTE